MYKIAVSFSNKLLNRMHLFDDPPSHCNGIIHHSLICSSLNKVKYSQSL